MPSSSVLNESRDLDVPKEHGRECDNLTRDGENSHSLQDPGFVNGKIYEPRMPEEFFRATSKNHPITED